MNIALAVTLATFAAALSASAITAGNPDHYDVMTVVRFEPVK